MINIQAAINGRTITASVEARLLLADFLRHHLQLTGTHIGCAHGVCGACTVVVDGRTARSCLMLAAQIDGQNVRTVESLEANDGALSVLQEEFHRHHALQCGYCTPGVLMTATELLEQVPEPDDALIRKTLSGNLCRCTGYVNIIRAVKAASQVLKSRTSEA